MVLPNEYGWHNTCEKGLIFDADTTHVLTLDIIITSLWIHFVLAGFYVFTIVLIFSMSVCVSLGLE
jgi:hypothetical protein